MARITCTHPHTQQIGPDRGYTGSVAVHPYTDENRAAHGNICFTQECCACGSRRSVLVNGRHEELGPWGATLRERQDAAAAARDEARKLLAATGRLTLTSSAKRSATVSLDGEGFVRVEGAEWSEIEHAVVPSQWFARARKARLAVLAASSAAAEVL